MNRPIIVYRLIRVAFLASLHCAGCGTDKAGPMKTNDTNIVVGGIYSIDDGEGRYGVVKVLVVDDFAVHVRLYKNKFDDRPQSIDTSTLSLGTIHDSDGFGIGHLPLAVKGFQDWNPVHLVTEQVNDDELDGYNLYLEGMNE